MEYTARDLYIGNIHYSITEEYLEKIIHSYGALVSLNIIKDKETNISRGFGFIEMASPQEAQLVINNLDGKEFKGRKLRVKYMESPDKGDDKGDNDAKGSMA